MSKKSKATTIVLALFLGGIGAHRFYLGQAGLGILYLVFCWTLIPAIVAIIDIIVIACTPTAAFDEKHNAEYLLFKEQMRVLASK